MNNKHNKGKQPTQISPLLGTGKANAIHLDTLSKITGLNDQTIKAIVKKERIAGALIISDTASGYYMAETRQEIADFIRWTESSAKSRHAILKHFKQALKDIDGQREIIANGKEEKI